MGASKIARDVTAARENERRIRLLMREVNHRVKNQFSVILSMISATARQSSDPKVFENRIRDRILALARSHDLLVEAEWSGTDLANLVKEHMRPFGSEAQILSKGPKLALTPNAVQHLGMAIHELGTNSAKYGALATEHGRVEITWSTQQGDGDPVNFYLDWSETGFLESEDVVPEEPRSGLGTIVLQRIVP